MTKINHRRPEGALTELPAEGSLVWRVQRLLKGRQLCKYCLRAASNEFPEHPRMFGVHLLTYEGDWPPLAQDDTLSKLDCNIIPNTYNDHYLFTDERLARRYYEEA